MIIAMYGDPTKNQWLDLPRMCKVTSRWAGSRGDIVDPPPNGLAILAAILRKQPGNRAEQDIHDLRELSDGSLIGSRLSNAELASLEDYPAFVSYTKQIRTAVFRGGKPIDVVVIDPVEDWVNLMVLAHPHHDAQYAMSFRERRIAEALYWLQREIPVVIICGERQRIESGVVTGIEPNLAPAVLRQVDAVIHIVKGKGITTFAHEHTGLTVGPIDTEQLAETLGFLVETV
jgi:hypothetical protein